jgi:cytochrome c biogenesis protein CcmG/thiol:disulfide interchange protein DsbE
MFKFLLLSTVMVLAPFAKADTAEDTTKAKPTMPSIMIKKLDGTPVNIQDYGKTGKIMVLSFWATWCTPCIKELNNVLELYDDWKKKYGLEVVAISMDDARTVSKVSPTVTALTWPYIILLDENKDLARAMNVNNPPQTILLDQSGHIVYVHNGYTEGSELELEEKIKALVKP